VCDVNSGREGLQVDSGDNSRKIRKKKQRRKTLSFFLLCLYLFFMICFVESGEGNFPP
jgi:hypothetical protein